MYWYIVSFFLASFAAAGGADDCWWTGCQPKTWRVRGCAQYGRKEAGKRSCKGGDEFKCCPSSASLISEIAQETIQSAVEPSCWWTSCQKNDSPFTECENAIVHGWRLCENGREYNCCDSLPLDEIEAEDNEDCLWSRCAVERCPDGFEAFGSRGCFNGTNSLLCCGKY